MTADLELTVLHEADDEHGYVAGFAVDDKMLVAVGGTSSRRPTVLASSNARHFEPRTTPRELGLRDALVARDRVWTCGEHGQLACSRDHGATWQLLETETQACLFALAVAADGSVWVVGEQGYVARVVAEDRVERVDFKTESRLASVHVVRDAIVVLGYDGMIYTWKKGEVGRVASGSEGPLTGMVVTRPGTWVIVGDKGFIARSPDGVWITRVRSGVERDLEAIEAMADGRLVVVGDRGQVLVSKDDGRTWSPVASGSTAHLWSVERFGPGVLIGGDDGMIAKLAPPADATWSDRANAFGGAKPLDEVFLAGPEGIVERIGNREPGTGNREREFEQAYGVAMPAELANLLAARGSFHELRLDDEGLPEVGEGNLFEAMVVRDQQQFLGTGLAEAFCGVFCLGSQGNGDTYHMEIYEWDGKRQVLHYDHETHAFTGVFSDSLESLVYLCALARAHDDKLVSDDAFAIGLRKLHGKVSPTWHFSIETEDPGFVRFEAKRRDSEFFFYRSRWICALLKNDRVTDVAEIPELFNADFNTLLPHDQLPARFEACEKFIPTALYSMWRAYLFDEPELPSYLDIGRKHAARLVRDAAKLVDALLAGRNTLGTIEDMRAHVAAFRALDLDPRRAEQRELEAEARTQAAGARKDEVVEELARTPSTDWTELAWRWLGDGVAHRALIQKLARTSPHTGQIEDLARLRDLHHLEREVALPRLAAELAPELEAVLVGALVRGDRLELAPPPDDDDDDDDDESPGWDAIDRALAPIYGTGEPHAHYGAALPYMLGGNDPIHGISVYLRDQPVPHFHFVTYGFTDLFQKDTSDPDESGFGFELTLRLGRAPDDTDVPPWALNFLQNLGRYVFGTGNRFAAGHKMGLNGPIALGQDTILTAILFATDPELGEIASPFGKASFVQIVGITDDEYRLIQEWSTPGLVDILQRQLPLLVTDLGRHSVLDDPALAAEARRRVEQDGSSEDLAFAGDMTFDVGDGRIRIELGALYAAALPRAMRGRIRHGRSYTLRGRDAVLSLEPAERNGYERGDGQLTLKIAADTATEIEARLRNGVAGAYRFELWPGLEIVVTHSFIRDQAGHAVEVRGIADPARAAQMIEEENARLAAEADEPEDDEDDDEDDDQDDDDQDDDEDQDEEDADPPASPERVTAALAISDRAMRLAPEDADVQFTHAMLLLDAERAGLAGKVDELLRRMPELVPSVRMNVATRMGKMGHARFVDAADVVLRGASYGDVAHELFAELGEALLEHSPDRMSRFAGVIPEDVDLLSKLAWAAVQADQREQALRIYERLFAMPVPEEGQERQNYVRALNSACVIAHAVKQYDTAAQIADRAQPLAPENPYIYHSAACAYAAVGDHAKAFEQVKLAVEHDYEHVAKIEVDTDLGPILDWPELKALFHDWHARRGGG